MTRLRQAIARQHRAQDGFTLIELVVTLTLITVGVTGFLQVFYGGMRLSLAANVRTRAAALAGLEIESARSVAYGSVGMDATLLGGATTYTDTNNLTYTYVTGGATAPTGTTSEAGTTYSLNRAIVWAAVGTNANAYKRVIVTVTWRDRSGGHSLRQDSVVYPGGLGVAGPTTSTTVAAATTTTTVAPSLSAPASLSAVASTLNPSSQIDLRWTAGAVSGTTWEVQHALTSDFASTTVDTTTQPLQSSSFSKTGLSGSSTFYFRVRARTATAQGPWSATASASTATPAQPACSVGTANVTPAGVNRANNGNGTLADPLNVTVNTSGTCSGLRLRFTANSSDGVVTTPLVAGGTGVWSLAIGTGTYNWDVGNKTLTVVDGSGTSMASISLLVCAKGNQCP